MDIKYLLHIIGFGLVLLFWRYLSILIHEIGHVIFAKLVRMNPYKVQIGTGRKLFVLKIKSIEYELYDIPNIGLTFANHTKADKLKLRNLFYVLGGISADFIVIITTIIIWKFVGYGIILLYIIIFESFSIIYNLLPFDININGKKFHRDGKLLISIIFSKEDIIITDGYHAICKDLHRYEKELISLPKVFLNKDLSMLTIFDSGVAALSERNFEKAIDSYEHLIRDYHISSAEKAYLLDALCGIVINNNELKYLDKADKWSEDAFSLVPYSNTIQGTRGAILVEKGRYSEAKKILLPLTYPGNYMLDRVVSACFLAKAEHFQGNPDESEKWLNFAENIDKSNPILERTKGELTRFSASLQTESA